MGNGILEGVEGVGGILEKSFGRYGTKTGARDYLGMLHQKEEIAACIEAVYKKISENYKKGSDSYSSQNWRFTLEVKIDPRNASAEKVLEKGIAKSMYGSGAHSWANQVPVASGLSFHRRDTKRSIDLVHELGKGSYEFIELKVASNNPVYAAIEVLVYGIVYVFFRVGGPETNRTAMKTDHDTRLLTANKVSLKAIAPSNYYQSYDKNQLRALADLFSDAVGDLAKNKIQNLRMNLSFEEFPDKGSPVNNFLENRSAI